MRKLILLAFLASPAFGAWSYYRAIAIDHTQVGTADSSAFPVLVSISHTTFKTVANGGHIQHTVTQSGGNAVTMPADLIFTSDSAGTTKLPWEVESYDATNGILVAWVKVATVSHTTDTTFYVFYDDAGVTTQQNTGSYSPANVWDASFGGVWHLVSTTSSVDSTSNGNTFSIPGTVSAVTGKINGGAGLSGSGSWEQAAAVSSLDGTAITMSGWVKFTALTTDYACPIQSGTRAMLFVRTTGHISVFTNASGGGVNYDGTGTAAAMTAGNWYHVAFTYDSTNGVRGYVNGVLDNSVAANGTLNAIGGNVTSMGHDSFSSGRDVAGVMDEVRMSSSARSSSWIAAEANNGATPGNIGAAGFLTFGAETTPGGGGSVPVRRRLIGGE